MTSRHYDLSCSSIDRVEGTNAMSMEPHLLHALDANLLYRFCKDDVLLDDSKTLGDCGFTNQTARPQAPGTVGLAFRANGKLLVLMYLRYTVENGHCKSLPQY